jgi:hypothetical protein
VWLSGQPWSADIKALYASPFYRTVHTAQLVLEQLCAKHGSSMGSGMSMAMSSSVSVTMMATAMPGALLAGAARPEEPSASAAGGGGGGLMVHVENGLMDEADWLANNAKPTKPWFLKAADLYLLSSRINLDYRSVKEPMLRDGEVYPGRPVEAEEPYDRCAVTGELSLSLCCGMLN